MKAYNELMAVPANTVKVAPVSTSCKIAKRSQPAVITCSAPTSHSAAEIAPL